VASTVPRDVQATVDLFDHSHDFEEFSLRFDRHVNWVTILSRNKKPAHSIEFRIVILSRLLVVHATHERRRHGSNKRLLQHGRMTAIGIDYSKVLN
jgi:hypothetical protein